MKKRIPLLALCCLVFTFAGCAPNTQTFTSDPKPNEYVEETVSTPTAYYMDGTPFTPVLRFVALADTHIMHSYMAHSKRFENLFTDAYDYARTQEYDKIDAVINCGDVVDDGGSTEYPHYAETWQKNILPETAFISLQAGHELLQGVRDDNILYTGCDMGTHAVINGYHFISISNSRYHYDENGNIVNAEDGSALAVTNPDPDCDVTWVEEALDEAVADTGENKPIFTFHHHPIGNTIMSTAAERTPLFAPIFENYTNIVDFSGHMHAPVVHPRSIMQKDYTTLTPGGMLYTGEQTDIEDGDGTPTVREAVSSNGSCMIVEVDADGRIRMLPYNVSRRQFYTQIGTGLQDQQIVYYIENAGDKSTWLYTEDRNDTTDLPVFEANATVKVRVEDAFLSTSPQIECKRLSLTFPNALDKDGVECYKVVLKNKSTGKVIPFYKTHENAKTRDWAYANSKFYLTPVPKIVTTETHGIERGAFVNGEYTVEIWAIDTWHNYSATPLTVDFTY